MRRTPNSAPFVSILDVGKGPEEFVHGLIHGISDASILHENSQSTLVVVKLWRLPFSHYSKRVEWTFRLAGIPYDTIDLTLPQMRQISRATANNTVPILEIPGQAPLYDSTEILAWAQEERPGLKLGIKQAEFVAWAAIEVGPVSRRVAYRAIYAHPIRYPAPRGFGFYKFARPVILAVLKFYKVRRYDESDPPALRAMIARAVAELDGNPFLAGSKPGFADTATAPLFEPIIAAAKVTPWIRETPGFTVVRKWIESTEKSLPKLVKNQAKVTEADWLRLEADQG